MSSGCSEFMQRVSGILANAGLMVRGEPDCSGELVRCGTVRKPNGTDGAYKVHLDFPPNVWLCNRHADGEGRTVPLWDKGEMDRLAAVMWEASLPLPGFPASPA